MALSGMVPYMPLSEKDRARTPPASREPARERRTSRLTGGLRSGSVAARAVGLPAGCRFALFHGGEAQQALVVRLGAPIGVRSSRPASS